MNSAPFRLVVFDLDGTLVDSRRDLAESANAVLESCGCPPHSEEAIGRMVGDGAATLVRRAFEGAGCPQPADALDRFLASIASVAKAAIAAVHAEELQTRYPNDSRSGELASATLDEAAKKLMRFEIACRPSACTLLVDGEAAGAP